MDYSSAEFLSKSLNQENTDHSVLVYQRDGVFVLSASGLIYAPIVLTLLILLTCVYKAYKTTLQRLTLYHILIVLFCKCTFALQIEINNETPRFLLFYFFMTAVANVSFVVTLHLLKAGNLKFRKDCKTVECNCLLMVIGLPMAYIWIPVRDQSYQVLSCDNNNSST